MLPVTKKPGTLAGRCLLETKADILTSGLTAPIVGHVGDGNFHLGILFDPQDAVETERAEALAFRTARRAIAMGGTCSNTAWGCTRSCTCRWSTVWALR